MRPAAFISRRSGNWASGSMRLWTAIRSMRSVPMRRNERSICACPASRPLRRDLAAQEDLAAQVRAREDRAQHLLGPAVIRRRVDDPAAEGDEAGERLAQRLDPGPGRIGVVAPRRADADDRDRLARRRDRPHPQRAVGLGGADEGAAATVSAAPAVAAPAMAAPAARTARRWGFMRVPPSRAGWCAPCGSVRPLVADRRRDSRSRPGEAGEKFRDTVLDDPFKNRLTSPRGA